MNPKIGKERNHIKSIEKKHPMKHFHLEISYKEEEFVELTYQRVLLQQFQSYLLQLLQKYLKYLYCRFLKLRELNPKQ
jgi:hypothetical protein